MNSNITHFLILIITGIPQLIKNLCNVTLLLWKTYVSGSFSRATEIWRGFLFLGKTAKNENCVQCWVCCYRGSTWPKQLMWPHHVPSSENILSISVSSIAFNHVFEGLCFISIYFVHLLARCIIKYQNTPRDYFLDWRILSNFSI